MRNPMMEDEITRFVRASVARELKLSPHEIDAGTDFEELGMTSLNAILVSGALEEEFGIEIEPSLLFENRTLASVSAAVRARIAGTARPA
jgi:acyl carrier protein